MVNDDANESLISPYSNRLDAEGGENKSLTSFTRVPAYAATVSIAERLGRYSLSTLLWNRLLWNSLLQHSSPWNGLLWNSLL